MFVLPAVLPRVYVVISWRWLHEKKAGSFMVSWRRTGGVMEEDRFLLASRSKDRGRADQASLHGPKTFSSGWISPKTSRQIHHTWLSPPATCIGTQSSKLEQWALVSYDICWWFQSQSLPLSSPVSWMQQCTSLSTAWQNIRARISQFQGLTMDSSASIRWLKNDFLSQ